MLKQKQNILNKVIENFDDSGFSKNLLKTSCKNCGYEDDFYQIAFENGISSLIEFYFLDKLAILAEKINQDNDFLSLKTHEKIEMMIKEYFKMFSQDKYFLKKCHYHMAMPQNLICYNKLKWKISDKMWQIANDKSIDFNYYTKRTTLLAVISAMLLYFINDDSDNDSDSWEFLQKQLGCIAQFGKFKFSLKQKLRKKPPL